MLEIVRFASNASRAFDSSIQIMSTLDKANISFNNTKWFLCISYLKNFLETRYGTIEALENYFVNLVSDEDITLKGYNLFGNPAVVISNTFSSPTSFDLSRISHIRSYKTERILHQRKR